MNINQTILWIVLGILVRIGIPLFITSLLFLLLNKLDQRWQAQSQGALVQRHDLIPCWQSRGCPEPRRQNCPAAACPTIPCWQTFRLPDGRLRENCWNCPVFRLTPVPSAS
ncbi:MAG: hypothetical protein N2049_05560 [Anaerolineales bacterium]|nr:hypothetical protein [Anaerolineales bacterium]MCX7608668.1 hypothetical protein [Anaerolineales bacterium]